MEQCDEKQPMEKPQDGQEPQETEGSRSKWRGALNSARRGILHSSEMINDATDVARQGIQRSGEVITDATTDATDVTVRGIRRSGEAISDATADAAGPTQEGGSTIR